MKCVVSGVHEREMKCVVSGVHERGRERVCVKADLFMKQVNHSLGLGLGLYSSSCLILQFSQACFQLQLALFSLLSCLLLALKPITLRLEEGKEKGKAGRQQFKMSRLLLYSKETVPTSLLMLSSPHHLSGLLLLGLGLHLLDLHGVQPPPTHVQVMVADTQLHNL